MFFEFKKKKQTLQINKLCSTWLCQNICKQQLWHLDPEQAANLWFQRWKKQNNNGSLFKVVLSTFKRVLITSFSWLFDGLASDFDFAQSQVLLYSRNHNVDIAAFHPVAVVGVGWPTSRFWNHSTSDDAKENGKSVRLISVIIKYVWLSFNATKSTHPFSIISWY